MRVQPPEDLYEALRIGRVRSKESRRPHARFAVERVDLEARVLGDTEDGRGAVDVRGVIQSLEARVLLEGRAGFFGLRHGRERVESDYFNAGIAQDIAN